jgi:hypothetical protein
MIAIVQDRDSVPVHKSRQRQDHTKFQAGILSAPKPKEQDKICLGVAEVADPCPIRWGQTACPYYESPFIVAHKIVAYSVPSNVSGRLIKDPDQVALTDILSQEVPGSLNVFGLLPGPLRPSRLRYRRPTNNNYRFVPGAV